MSNKLDDKISIKNGSGELNVVNSNCTPTARIRLVDQKNTSNNSNQKPKEK